MPTGRSHVQLNYTASQHVSDVIASLGRTEDIKFSPSDQRLAIAGFAKNTIAVFDICIAASEPKIHLTGVREIYSTHLNEPHGLDFLEEEFIVVANRGGGASIFKLPSSEGLHKLEPIEVIPAGDLGLLQAPGSVSISKKEQKVYEALICNNYGHNVTRHTIDFTQGCTVKSNEVFLERWLDIPDGVCVSKDRQWIAISNHRTQSVFLYNYSSALNMLSDPDGILRCTYYPHGLCFTSDSRCIIVADAGAPYVHLYAKEDSSWRGLHNPHRSFRVMNDEDFLRGRQNTQEGGPKGIDLHKAMNIFAITCEYQPLLFFDLATILRNTDCRTQKKLEVKYELDLQHKLSRAAQAEAQVALLNASRFWRITAPLRKALSHAIPTR
jgi:WD40 repeat protein